jgi:hypothetical protein
MAHIDDGAADRPERRSRRLDEARKIVWFRDAAAHCNTAKFFGQRDNAVARREQPKPPTVGCETAGDAGSNAATCGRDNGGS